jgi:thiol-disulfide isomerase/thioredoxin
MVVPSSSSTTTTGEKRHNRQILTTMRMTSCCLSFFLIVNALLQAPVVTALHMPTPWNYRNGGSSSSSSSSSRSTNQKSLAYTNHADHNDMFVTPRTTFTERMRNVLMDPKKRKNSNHQSNDIPSSTTTTSPVRIVTTLHEFQSVLAENNRQNQITVVRWYASWCRTCKVMQPFFDGLHRKYPTATRNIQYVAIPFVPNVNDAFIAGMNIPSVPYVHMYHPQLGLIEQLKFKPQTAKDFEQILQSYLVGSCPLVEYDDDDHRFVYRAPYQRIS